MLRAKAISIMVKKVERTAVFQNMQTKGLITLVHYTANVLPLRLQWD